MNEAQEKFAEWVRQTHPGIYAQAMARTSTTVDGVELAGSFSDMFSNLIKTGTESVNKAVKEASGYLPAVISAKVQERLFKENAKRATRGQDPLTPQQMRSFAESVMPTVRVQATTGEKEREIMKYGMIGLGVLGLVWLATRPKKRR